MTTEEARDIMKVLGRLREERPLLVSDFDENGILKEQKPQNPFQPYYITGMQ